MSRELPTPPWARALLVAALLAWAAPASAGGPADRPDVPPRFFGFALRYTVWDSSGVDGAAYQNALGQLFEPSWNARRRDGDSDPGDGHHVGRAWVTASPRVKPDGSFRQPFYDRSYSTLKLSLSISIDKLAGTFF